MEPDEFRRVTDINLTGTFLGTVIDIPQEYQNIEHGRAAHCGSRDSPLTRSREGSGSDPSQDDDDAPITVLSWWSSSRGSFVHVIDIKYCVP